MSLYKDLLKDNWAVLRSRDKDNIKQKQQEKNRAEQRRSLYERNIPLSPKFDDFSSRATASSTPMQKRNLQDCSKAQPDKENCNNVAQSIDSEKTKEKPARWEVQKQRFLAWKEEKKKLKELEKQKSKPPFLPVGKPKYNTQTAAQYPSFAPKGHVFRPPAGLKNCTEDGKQTSIYKPASTLAKKKAHKKPTSPSPKTDNAHCKLKPASDHLALKDSAMPSKSSIAQKQEFPVAIESGFDLGLRTHIHTANTVHNNMNKVLKDNALTHSNKPSTTKPMKTEKHTGLKPEIKKANSTGAIGKVKSGYQRKLGDFPSKTGEDARPNPKPKLAANLKVKKPGGSLTSIKSADLNCSSKKLATCFKELTKDIVSNGCAVTTDIETKHTSGNSSTKFLDLQKNINPLSLKLPSVRKSRDTNVVETKDETVRDTDDANVEQSKPLTVFSTNDVSLVEPREATVCDPDDANVIQSKSVTVSGTNNGILVETKEATVCNSDDSNVTKPKPATFFKTNMTAKLAVLQEETEEDTNNYLKKVELDTLNVDPTVSKPVITESKKRQKTIKKRNFSNKNQLGAKTIELIMKLPVIKESKMRQKIETKKISYSTKALKEKEGIERMLSSTKALKEKTTQWPTSKQKDNQTDTKMRQQTNPLKKGKKPTTALNSKIKPQTAEVNVRSGYTQVKSHYNEAIQFLVPLGKEAVAVELFDAVEKNVQNKVEQNRAKVEILSSEHAKTLKEIPCSSERPMNYMSPFVSVSRGKVSTRKEKEKRNSIYLQETPTKSSAKVATPETPIEKRRALEAVRYFRQQLDDEIQRLHELCDQWNAYKENNMQLLKANNVEDMINVTIGQTRLLTSKKFMQFSGLIDRCEAHANETALNSGGSQDTKTINPMDLEGFWAMLGLQVRKYHAFLLPKDLALKDHKLKVENVGKRFQNLERWKENGWNDPDAVKLKPSIRKNLTKTKKSKKIPPMNGTTKPRVSPAFCKIMRQKTAATRFKSEIVWNDSNIIKSQDVKVKANKQSTACSPRCSRGFMQSNNSLSSTPGRINIVVPDHKSRSLARTVISVPSPLSSLHPKSKSSNTTLHRESTNTLKPFVSNELLRAAVPVRSRRSRSLQSRQIKNTTSPVKIESVSSPIRTPKSAVLFQNGCKSILKTPGTARSQLKNVVFNNHLSVKKFRALNFDDHQETVYDAVQQVHIDDFGKRKSQPNVLQLKENSEKKDEQISHLCDSSEAKSEPVVLLTENQAENDDERMYRLRNRIIKLRPSCEIVIPK